MSQLEERNDLLDMNDLDITLSIKIDEEKEIEKIFFI